MLLFLLGEPTSLENKMCIYLCLHSLQAWHCLSAFHVSLPSEYFQSLMVSTFLVHLSLTYLPCFFECWLHNSFFNCNCEHCYFVFGLGWLALFFYKPLCRSGLFFSAISPANLSHVCQSCILRICFHALSEMGYWTRRNCTVTQDKHTHIIKEHKMALTSNHQPIFPFIAKLIYRKFLKKMNNIGKNVFWSVQMKKLCSQKK